jgi:tetratricopeptide (TPR) repeat protein
VNGLGNGWQLSGVTHLESGANLTYGGNGFGGNAINAACLQASAIIPGSVSTANPQGIAINNQSILGTPEALMFTGDSDLSATQYEDEIRVDPYNFEANLQLGVAACEEQDYEKAGKYFRRAEETRPGDPGVRYQLALIAIDEGHLDEARNILEGLVKQSPQFTEAHVSLSLVYYRLKRPEDSKREREIVLKLTAEAQAKQPGAKLSGAKVQ